MNINGCLLLTALTAPLLYVLPWCYLLLPLTTTMVQYVCWLTGDNVDKSVARFVLSVRGYSR